MRKFRIIESAAGIFQVQHRTGVWPFYEWVTHGHRKQLNPLSRFYRFTPFQFTTLETAVHYVADLRALRSNTNVSSEPPIKYPRVIKTL